MAKTPEKNEAEAQPATAPPTAPPNVRMVSSTQPPDELYVDGVSAIIGRGGVIKLDCYRVVGVDRENAEVRSVTHRLVLPAGAVPGLVRLFQNMANIGQQSVAESGTGETEAEKKK